MKPHMEDGSCKLDGGDGPYKMYEPAAEWLLGLPSLSFLQVCSPPPQQRHISAEQHKQFSHSLCLSCFLSSGAMHVRWLPLWMEGRSGGRNRETGGGRGGRGGGTWRRVERRRRGRRPDASDKVRGGGGGEEAEEAVCGLIPLKASVLSAGSNYYQRARNKGSARGRATQESASPRGDSQKKVTRERNNGRWEHEEEGGEGGEGGEGAAG